ncbi:MAG: DUF4147 domain-containing protein [Candidatus Portnoybacteria bacterium]|nr:DUF4147 domain-containing protein [Candidatus Portnoybacteria bacterium]
MITNYKQLATTELRKKAIDIIDHGLEFLNIEKIVKEKFILKNNTLEIYSEKDEPNKYNLNNYKNIYVISIGKGSSRAAKEIERILNKRIHKGITLDTEKAKLKHFKSFKGTHPLPSKKNQKAAKAIVKNLKKTKPEDLVLFLVFGGASALLSYPAKISIKQLKQYTEELIKSGKGIHQINTIRKHISRVKGGQLTKLIYPTASISCIFSDVLGNDLAFVASGPTVRDQTTIADAKEIAKEFNWPKDIFIETPKDQKYFSKNKNILIFSNNLPLLKMKKRAERLGYNTEIYSFKIKGEAKETAKKLLDSIKSKNKKPPQLILAGGETTVTVKGRGKGGRNQELVLAALEDIKENELIASIASDGRDNTEAAGAIGDTATIKKANQLNLNPHDYLNKNDSFHFFKKTGDLIYSKKGINVADFILLIKNP